jgi:very-short-patch-repair endonuclease
MNTPPQTYVRAQALRRALTREELALWLRLKGRQVADQKFRCQHPIGPYILDFYCGRARLAVELDGPAHQSQEQLLHDARRDRWLRSQGVETLRLPLGLLRTDCAQAMAMIEQAVLTRIKAREGGPPQARQRRPGRCPEGTEGLTELAGEAETPVARGMGGGNLPETR